MVTDCSITALSSKFIILTADYSELYNKTKVVHSYYIIFSHIRNTPLHTYLNNLQYGQDYFSWFDLQPTFNRLNMPVGKKVATVYSLENFWLCYVCSWLAKLTRGICMLALHHKLCK